MKTATKILLCLLSLCIILGAFAACGEKKESTPAETTGQTDNGAEVTTTPEDDGIPTIDKTFNNMELTVLLRQNTANQYGREWGYDAGTDNLSEQIVKRNSRVEQDLDISLAFKTMVDDSAGTDYVNKVVQAWRSGLNEVDIVSSYAAYSTLPAAMECYANLLDGNRFPYFQFYHSYWNRGYLDVAELNGKLFTTVGDANLSVYDRTIITYVNKNLAVENNVALDDIYETVLAGDWTYEKFYKIVTDIGYHDIDEEEGVSGEDFFALTSIKSSEAPDGFLQAFDLAIFEKDPEGNWSLAGSSMRNKLEDGMTKIQNLFNNSNSAFTRGDSSLNTERFTERRAVFNIDVIYHYDSALNKMLAMKDEIGMIPVPKYDENQKSYKASVQDAHNVVSVIDYGNASGERYEAISAFLELLNYDSYQNLRPYYFERMIKTRYVDGAEDAQIFDIILASTAWDFSDVYGGNLSITSDSGTTMWAPRHLLWRAAFQNNVAVSTRFSSFETTIDTNLAKFLTWMKGQS